MKRAAVWLSIAMGLGMLLVGKYPNGLAASLLAADADAHAYFRALTADPAHYRSYSLRSQVQLDTYRQSSSTPASATYAPNDDLFAKPQDAAKVTVPAFRNGAILMAPMGTDDTTVTLSTRDSTFGAGNSIRIDAEIMKITAVSGLVLTVSRGAWGTTRTAHADRVRVQINTYNMPNQVWLPMATEDGHTYLTTWDTWYSKELQSQLSGLNTWKNYQFRRVESGGAAIWFEVRTRFDLGVGGDIGAVDVRGYGGLGPNVTKDAPITPQAGTFMIKPETWTRYWMQIEQRPNTWDLVSMWVADETRGPVKILDRIQIETYNSASGKATIHSFQLEFNTSTTKMTVLHGDLVTYVRNVVMLKDYGDPSNILLRPIAGTAPAPRLGAPKNVRIVGS